jgi:hypothetical protein
MASVEAPSGIVLVLTPIGRDAEASARLIKHLGMPAEICQNFANFGPSLLLVKTTNG